MASKSKVDSPAVEEPPAKKAKAEEPEAKFEEPDAPKDTRPSMKETIGFDNSDLTLNAIPTLGGKVLMPISEGGMAYLTAGARANVAQKSGRYMFEAKIIQLMTPAPSQRRDAGAAPRMLLRIGFSTANSTLMLGDDEHSLCFDSDGSFLADKKRVQGPPIFTDRRRQPGITVAVVLNLDSKSPNFNTVTLYCDGKRLSEPKAIPEELKGKPLYPHVCFRSMSLQVNFGPTALTALPFKCRTLQDAAQPDVLSTASKGDGKCEVMLPVAFPDEGTFDWLDTWLEKNPKFVELSDRKIMDWARSSGLWSRNERKLSNDKPAFAYGIEALDNLSVRTLINIIAPLVPRNYVVMEVKSNLVENERKAILKKFNNPCYKKVARVVMGDPSKEFKAMVHSKILKEKQARADQDWRQRKADRDRKKEQEKRQKEAAARRKEEDDKRAKEKAEKEQAAKEKAEAEAKAKAAEEGKEGDAPKEEEEKPAEEPKKEEEVKAEEVEKEAEEEPEETEPPAVTLSEEEQATKFETKKWADLSPHVMNAFFTQFSTPQKAEGFDDIQFEWDPEPKSKEYLKLWITNKKLNTRIEDLKPGEFFTSKSADFGKVFNKWQDRLKTMEPKAPKEAPKEGEEEEEEELDVMTVEDIDNIGENVPLFEKFQREDWALTQLRFELHMLATSFKKDANDEERTGIPLDHVPFYYHKYFNKMFCSATFGMTDQKDIFNLVKDTAAVKEGLLVSELDAATESLEIFVKLTEASRRARQRRIEAGDETAKLKYDPHAAREMERGGRDSRGPRVPVGEHGPRGNYQGKDFKGKGKDFKGKGKGKY